MELFSLEEKATGVAPVAFSFVLSLFLEQKDTKGTKKIGNREDAEGAEEGSRVDFLSARDAVNARCKCRKLRIVISSPISSPL